jgi:hypothetical protein
MDMKKIGGIVAQIEGLVSELKAACGGDYEEEGMEEDFEEAPEDEMEEEIPSGPIASTKNPKVAAMLMIARKKLGK